MLKLILILAACGFAASDSLAVARFHADSTQAEKLFRSADSVAHDTKIYARAMFDLAVRNLQRDTTKAGK